MDGETKQKQTRARKDRRGKGSSVRKGGRDQAREKERTNRAKTTDMDKVRARRGKVVEVRKSRLERQTRTTRRGKTGRGSSREGPNKDTYVVWIADVDEERERVTGNRPETITKRVLRCVTRRGG